MLELHDNQTWTIWFFLVSKMQSHVHCSLLLLVFVLGTGECAIASNTPLFWFCYIDGWQKIKSSSACSFIHPYFRGLQYWILLVLLYSTIMGTFYEIMKCFGWLCIKIWMVVVCGSSFPWKCSLPRWELECWNFSCVTDNP